MVARNFNSSAGFDACTLLDVGQNTLNGTLPPDVGAIGASLGLSLYDNLLSGTVPPSYASLSWLALAYNPLLVGALPAGVTASKLQAWCGYYARFYPWSASAVVNVQGLAPLYSTGYLYGTSIGLDRPLASILLDIKAALDPSGSVLRSWNASQLQPCRPWITNNGAYSGQNAKSRGYGAAWQYVSTDASTTSAEYCQDVGSHTYTSAYPAVREFNTALAGGMSALWLKGLGLNGTVPCSLSDLRTVSSVTLATNALTGFLPPSLMNITALNALSVQVNRLQGAIPTEYGAFA
jgi:hypothetical protein